MQILDTNYEISKSQAGLIYHNFADPQKFDTIDPSDVEAIRAAENLLELLKIPAKFTNPQKISNEFNKAQQIILHRAYTSGMTLNVSTAGMTHINNGTITASPLIFMNNPNNLNQIVVDSIINGETPQEEITISSESVESNKSITRITQICQKIIDFFSEFQFAPNYRFVNTLYWHCIQDDATEYVTNYFKTIDSQYVNSIIEKMKSAEFKQIIKNLKELPQPSTKINKRFKLYFGAPGSGKTQAIENETDLHMGCHSGLIASELLEVFDFNDENGHPVFKPTTLQKAMTEGKKIHLEEINLLPYESLRYLQILLDNKTQIEFKGKTIKILDGFQIIASMNLDIDNCTYALPTPLVDRAYDIKEFILTANDLANVLI